MRCKVLSASLGYKGKVYFEGEYIELESEKEVEELISFGCIITTPIVKVKLVEIEVPKEEEKAEPIEPEALKEDVKSISGGKVRSQPGGRKRK